MLIVHPARRSAGPRGRFVASAICAASTILPLLLAATASADQTKFDSPEATLAALKAAVEKQDAAAVRQLFGPGIEDLKSGDEVQDKKDFKGFARRLNRFSRLEKVDDDAMTLLVGAERFPFPIPIVRQDGKWYFDTDAGKDEMLSRRIGENELGAISVCNGYVVAQREYAQDDHDGDDVLEYAQQFASTPGKQDGLYWETAEDEPPSPLGPLVADARAEGYSHGTSDVDSGPRPYHGYLYRMLTRQGEHAPGGKHDYIINGHMIAGFALVAWPVQYGQSGIMTFLVGPNGKVYQKDLGAETEKLVAKIDTFDIDKSWRIADDEPAEETAPASQPAESSKP